MKYMIMMFGEAAGMLETKPAWADAPPPGGASG